MKKMAVLALMGLIAVAVSQPAMAGVGGCGTRPGVGGCWQLTDRQVENTPTVLEVLGSALPAHISAMLRLMFEQKSDTPVLQEPGELQVEGVGGCFRPGVGGCVL
ncbi:MAG TPA: hypothetical protein VJV23_17100 [Candidatus Polarisedimenticolia bacterium]|nr:hypothetical protein [Candidatus Polarisedimenticolia bacterium]